MYSAARKSRAKIRSTLGPIFRHFRRSRVFFELIPVASSPPSYDNILLDLDVREIYRIMHAPVHNNNSTAPRLRFCIHTRDIGRRGFRQISRGRAPRNCGTTAAADRSSSFPARAYVCLLSSTRQAAARAVCTGKARGRASFQCAESMRCSACELVCTMCSNEGFDLFREDLLIFPIGINGDSCGESLETSILNKGR